MSDHTLLGPVISDRKGRSLLDICQKQIVNEEHILILGKRAFIKASPEDKPIGKEEEEGKRRKKGNQAYCSHRNRTAYVFDRLRVTEMPTRRERSTRVIAAYHVQHPKECRHSL